MHAALSLRECAVAHLHARATFLKRMLARAGATQFGHGSSSGRDRRRLAERTRSPLQRAGQRFTVKEQNDFAEMLL